MQTHSNVRMTGEFQSNIIGPDWADITMPVILSTRAEN